MDTGLLLSAMLIGTVGLGLFLFGKKSENIGCLALGLALMVYPYFVHSILAMWLIAAGVIAAAYAWRRFAVT